ncbi:hypothetical protein KBC89_05370 [Candidatus Woesebacteria bacterium]|nr:hypothetical protein [Candidatus Woesebacteria bacterium]
MSETSEPQLQSQKQEMGDFKQWVTSTHDKFQTLFRFGVFTTLNKEQLDEAQSLVDQVKTQLTFFKNARSLTADTELLASIDQLLGYTENVKFIIQENDKKIAQDEKLAEVQASVQTILQRFRNESIPYSPSTSDTFVDGTQFIEDENYDSMETDNYEMVNADEIIQRVTDQAQGWINQPIPPTEQQVYDFLTRLSNDIQINVQNKPMYLYGQDQYGFMLSDYSDDLLDFVEQQRAQKSEQ